MDPPFRTSDLYGRHLRDLEMDIHRSQSFIVAVTLLLRVLSHQFSDVPPYVDNIHDVLNRVSTSQFASPRRIELEILKIGRVSYS